MKTRYILTAYVLILLAMHCLAASPVCAGVEKDTLVIGLKDNSISLDPAVAYEITGGQIHYQVYDQLIKFKKGDYSQFVPGLAEFWEVAEDGRTWTFHLRKGVRFASGNTVNADAVVFSLRRALQIAGNPVWLLTQFDIREDSIKQVDEHTVQMTLDQQYAPGLLFSCLAAQVASIVDPALVKEHEQNGDMGSTWLHDHSAGSGPYLIEERKQNDSVTLQANEHYWGEKPVFERVILKNVPESFDQLTLLKQGEIDIAWDLLPEQTLEVAGNPDIQVLETLTFNIIYLGMNTGYEPLVKSEVRKALRYAIDYDGIITYLLQGSAVKIQTFIPKGILGHDPALPYNRDVDKAKQLLEEAGYPQGFDVEVLCFNFSPWLDIAQKIKSDLTKVGITAKVNPQPVDQVLHTIRSREHQLYVLQWLLDYVDPDANAKGFAHSDSLGDDATVKLLPWWCNYLNLETSKMVEQAAQELDTEKRKALYEKIAAIIRDDGPFVFLYTPIHQYGIRSEILELINPEAVSLYDLPIP